jgi:hypothetical protein
MITFAPISCVLSCRPCLPAQCASPGHELTPGEIGMRPRSVLLSASAMAVLMVVAAPCGAQPPADSGKKRAAWVLGAMDRGSLTLGANLGYGYFPGFTDTVGDQPDAVDVSGDNGTTQYGGFVEYRLPTKLPLAAGLSVTYGKQDYTQTLQPNAAQTPVTVDGSVGGWFTDLYLSYMIATRIFGLRFKGGCSHTIDKLNATVSYGDISSAMRDQHSGFKTILGTSLDLPFTQRSGFRASADYITGFKGGDADAHGRFSLGFTHRFDF